MKRILICIAVIVAALMVVSASAKKMPNDNMSRAYECLETGDTIQAVKYMKEAGKLDLSIENLYELAYRFLVLDCLAEADEVYKRLVKKDLGSPYPYYGLARIAYTDARYDDAIMYIEKSRQLDTLTVTPDILLMHVYTLQEDYPRALDVAIGVLKEDIFNIEVANTIAYLNGVVPDTTIDALRRAVSENPNNNTLRLVLANEYQHQGNYSKALKIYEEFLDNEDYTERVISSVIECCEALGDLERAATLKKEYREILPEDENANE